MSNDEIIDSIELQAKLLELHKENPFKVKAFSNAAFKLNKLRIDFNALKPDEINSIDGVGKGIAAFINEIIQYGSAKEQDVLIDKTPSGVIDMLSIKGLGPKKVNAIWKELGCESIGELLYACNENRLAGLKGFGTKTQDAVIKNIEFLMQNNHKRHYASVEQAFDLWKKEYLEDKEVRVEPTGAFRRKCQVLDVLEIISNSKIDTADLEKLSGLKVKCTFSSDENFAFDWFSTTGSPEHLNKLKIKENKYKSENEIYQSLGLQFIEPELREGLNEIDLAKQNKIPELIELKDLKGCLHNHTNYSDGVNSLKEMADACIKKGLEYFGVCDHSKSAFYANGLSEERVLQQFEEIDALNKSYSDFKILKGIESDILNDGSLDYSNDILKQFDFVVASVHSNLKMDEEKATQRLIKAIENPYTSILGHPTGRLLLAREGYPINHKKVIDACAANKVHIELNAHPYRLDIDWRWIPYCLEKGVKVSINPDAHIIEGIDDMHYGVCVARKGMLTKEMCLNALSLTELEKVFKK